MGASVFARIKRRLNPPPPAPVAPEPATKPKRKKRAAKAMRGINTYGSRLTDEEMAAGRHRQHVGGLWDVAGPAQLEFMIGQGMKPSDRLIDIGCGAMRGGIHFARYLDPGNYYGTDINDRLIKAARDIEIPKAGLTDRVPRENLRITGKFDGDFGVQFDYAFANSVFSHLPMNIIRLCLAQTAKVMRPGGSFYATFFVVPDSLGYDEDFQQPATVSHAIRDPFHYRVNEMEWAATVADWNFDYVGDWGHARGQVMARYTRR
jgi:SAM-dependent methyltransferase